MGDWVIKRQNAYRKQYGFENTVHLQYGVTIICEHYHMGKINIGKKVLLARDVDIDYTGDLTIGNGVSISEGVKILTHNHSTEVKKNDLEKGCILTPLCIHDNVRIGARVLILPGVNEIGRRALISASSVVKRKVKRIYL